MTRDEGACSIKNHHRANGGRYQIPAMFRAGLIQAALLSLVISSLHAAENSCSVLVSMANGASLPRNLRVQVFSADRPIVVFSIGHDGSSRPAPMEAGDYSVQISEKSTSFINVGKWRVRDGEPCIYATSLQGKVASDGTRIMSSEVDVEDLQASPEIRRQFTAGLQAFSRGETAKAEAIFTQIISVAPKLARAFNVLGIIANQRGDSAKAEEYFQRAILLNPRSGLPLINLLKTMMQRHEYASASALLETHRTVFPQTAELHSLRADVNFELGRCDAVLSEAASAHALALTLAPFVHVIAARCWNASRNFANARLEYQAYLNQAPNGAMAAQVLNELRVLESQGPPRPNYQPVPVDSYLPPDR